MAIIVEPDALAITDCLDAFQKADRFASVKDAIDELTSNTNAAVYLDAGNSHILPVWDIASRLTSAGVSRARGFALNVSTTYETAEQVKFGEAVSAKIGGKRYVVDTSRNGLGPAPDGPLSWCNPAGRALGVRPTVATSGKHADAYLWVKPPGESDGSCGRDEPAPGTWWNDYAVGLVERSSY